MSNLTFDDVKVEEFTINGDESKKIYFAPTDNNVLARFKESQDYFDNLYQNYKPDDSAESVFDYFESFKKMDKEVKEKLDYIFNANISETIFGEKSCLSIASNGLPIFQNVLDTLINVVLNRILEKEEEEVKQDIKRVKNDTKTQKYLNKYNHYKKNGKRNDFKKSN